MLLKKVSSYVAKYHMLSAGDIVVAGVSGGADSVCLLLVLYALQKEIPFSLSVVHVNHLIRPEAGQDAAFVEDLCKRLGVSFHLVEKDVAGIAAKEGISTEEAGRQVRYAAFEEVLLGKVPAKEEGRARIAVAHSLNDRAETMLFHLFRGSGLAGLSSIRPVRKGEGKPDIIRPLLCLTRKEIEDFLTGRGMSWCTDSTNAEDTYTRNRIRHHILPYAEKEIAGGVVTNMGYAADILSETADFVQAETKKAYEECRVLQGGETGREALNVARLLTRHPLIQKETILYCLGRVMAARKDITHVHVEDILSLFNKSGNREVYLPKGIRVRREYEQVIFEKIDPAQKNLPKRSRHIVLPKPGEASLQIRLSEKQTVEFTVLTCEKSLNIPQNQCTKWFDYDKIEKSLEIRTRQTGDYLTFNQALSRKSIQDYMVEEKIPKNDRDNIWLLAEENHILWVMGHRISSYYKINENTNYILQVQLRGG